MSGAFNFAGSDTQSTSNIVAPNNAVTVTDGVAQVSRVLGGQGNIRLRGHSQLTINQGLTGGQIDGRIAAALAPLRELTKPNATAVDGALESAMAAQVTRLEDDRQQVSVASVKKYLVWAVVVIGLAAVFSVVWKAKKKR